VQTITSPFPQQTTTKRKTAQKKKRIKADKNPKKKYK
jgi:hypothetical protein